MSRGPLDVFDDFYPSSISRKPALSKKKIRKMSKKQLRQALLSRSQGFGGRGRSQEGLALAEMLKSKEFKERVELLKEGGKLTVKGTKIAYAKGRIAATKLASRIRKARSKSIYE